MDFVETVKIDDPRLDESFSFLFVFRKGDVVVSRENRALRGRSMTVSISESFLTERESPQPEGQDGVRGQVSGRRAANLRRKRDRESFGVKESEPPLAFTADFSK